MNSLIFFEKVTILSYGFSLDVEILWFFMLLVISTLNEKPQLIIIIFQYNDEIFIFFWKSDNP